MSTVKRSSNTSTQAGTQAASSVPVVLFCVGTFLFWASLYVYVPVLSVYARSMGASLTLVGLVVGMYGATQLVTRIPIGFFSDLVGRRKPFILAGLLLAGLGCLGLAWSPSAWFLVVSRGILGLGAAMWVAFSVFFAGYFALNRTAQAMSVISFVNGAAQGLAGLAGGYLSQQFGTVSTFYVGAGLAALGLVVMLPVREVVKPRPAEMSVGRLVAIAGTPAVIVAGGVSMVNTYANFTITLSFMPIYARSLGATDSELGLLSAIAVVAYTVATLTGAAVADRMGDRGVIVLGMVLAGAASGLTPLTHSLGALAAVQVLAGLGRGVCNPTLMSLSIRGLPPHERASGMGIYQAVYSIGMFFGPPLGGAVADALGLPSVFLLTAGFCALAAVWGLMARGLK